MKRTSNRFVRFMSVVFAVTTVSAVFANPAPKAEGEKPEFRGYKPPVMKFTGEKVKDSDLSKIISAGTAIPNEDKSWHFAVVTNPKVLAKIDESVKNPPEMKAPKKGEPVPVPKDPTVKKQGDKKVPEKPKAKAEKSENKNAPKDAKNAEEAKRNGCYRRPHHGMPGMDMEAMKKMAEKGINGAPVAIVVSSDFMSGMGSMYAMQCMTKKAMELGYFVQVLNPLMVRGLNEGDLKAEVKSPEGMPVGAVMLIGKAEFAEKPENFDGKRPEMPVRKERPKAKEAVTYVK